VVKVEVLLGAVEGIEQRSEGLHGGSAKERQEEAREKKKHDAGRAIGRSVFLRREIYQLLEDEELV